MCRNPGKSPMVLGATMRIIPVPNSVTGWETGVISRPEWEIPYWFIKGFRNRRSPPVLLLVPGFNILACGGAARGTTTERAISTMRMLTVP